MEAALLASEGPLSSIRVFSLSLAKRLPAVAGSFSRAETIMRMDLARFLVLLISFLMKDQE
jgi:hypothetical protein